MVKNAMVEALSPQVISAMKSKGVWQGQCPVPLERLSLLKIHYVDFDAVEHDDGQMVVFDVIAEPVARVFAELHRLKFPIAGIRPLHEFAGDDELSMEANNSSCFCFRQMLGTQTISVHAYGLAVDINPLQNPYLTFDQKDGIVTCHPKAGWQYLNRYNQVAGMVEEVADLFAEIGLFEWGGRWQAPVDYHHFQTPRGVAELLCMMNFEDGKRFLQSAIDHRNTLPLMPCGNKLKPIADLYSSNKEEFFAEWFKLVIA